MAFIEYIQKLMGWCPMKNSLRKEKQENYFSSFKLESGSQLAPSPASLQESKALKGRVLYRGYGTVKIIITALVISLILGLCSPAGSFSHLFSSLILYLAFLVFIRNYSAIALSKDNFTSFRGKIGCKITLFFQYHAYT
ncbi:TPA: DUF1673 family protein [Methanosarcinaceae archaeon]|nr:DUF1673 family protein [Methanosarcinaceae archaeon]